MWIMWAVVVVAAAAVVITAFIVTGSVISNISSDKTYEHIENQKFNNEYLKDLINRVECLECNFECVRHNVDDDLYVRVNKLEEEFDIKEI